eukprot:TRINITY_DN210_c0_g1_i2.p1 TRINITY_DN210_c0_g1~~TRINITY_DN210_c0_g1_i2.p1  ORF type:complete len:468 (+),score=25.46 TRINITY_DN210_c0_g1_i2:93-1406(+)
MNKNKVCVNYLMRHQRSFLSLNRYSPHIISEVLWHPEKSLKRAAIRKYLVSTPTVLTLPVILSKITWSSVPENPQQIFDFCISARWTKILSLEYLLRYASLSLTRQCQVIMLAFLFYYIGGTAEHYLTPTLAKIARFFNMSENFAGVTFLAFGNACADCISSIVASGLGTEGVYISASGLVGSCAILTFFLAPAVILSSKKKIMMSAATTSRDILFHIGVLIMLIVYMYIGTIHWGMALVFPVAYGVYVATCYLQDRYYKKQKANEEELKHIEAEKMFEKEFVESQNKAEEHGEEIVRREGDSFIKYTTNIDTGSFIDSHIQEPETVVEKEEKEEDFTNLSPEMAQAIRNRIWSNTIIVAMNMYFLKDDFCRAETHEEEENRSIIGKLFHYIISVPCAVIRNISIPPNSEENWSRVRASFFPIGAFGILCLFLESIC